MIFRDLPFGVPGMSIGPRRGAETRAAPEACFTLQRSLLFAKEVTATREARRPTTAGHRKARSRPVLRVRSGGGSGGAQTSRRRFLSGLTKHGGPVAQSESGSRIQVGMLRLP